MNTTTKEKKESKRITIRLNVKDHTDYVAKCKANGWTISKKIKDAISILNNSN